MKNVLIAVFFCIALISCAYEECTGICQLGAMQLYVANWQVFVEAQLAEKGVVSSDSIKTLVEPEANTISAWAISKDGRILVQARDRSVFAVYLPVKIGDSISWVCYGSPAKVFEKDYLPDQYGKCSLGKRLKGN